MSAWPAFSNKEANPYNWLLYSAIRELGVRVDEGSRRDVFRSAPDIVHIHWPDGTVIIPSTPHALARIVDLLAQLVLLKLRGAKVVWTAHNLHAHGKLHPFLEPVMWWGFTRLVDGVIAMSLQGLDDVLRTHPALGRARHFVIPHGHYRDIYPDRVSKQDARALLGIERNARVVEFFGSISPYKNLPRLIKAFREIKDPNLRLIIAGYGNDKELLADVQDSSTGDPRIHLHLHHIKAEDVQMFLAATDLVVLPYTEILNSGTALLALSCARPILVPSKGAMPELRDEVGSDWALTYAGEITPQAIQAAITWATELSRPASPSLDNRSWAGIALMAYSVYVALVSKIQSNQEVA